MSDRLLRERASARLVRGERTVVVEVVRSRGSVPRGSGTRMLVDAVAIDGTIGGGNLEWRAIDTARRMLSDAAHRPGDEEIPLGASLGQCCGGAVALRYRMLDGASLAAWRVASLPTVQVYGAGHVGRAIVHVLALLDVRVQWIDERETASQAQPSADNVQRICVDTVEAETRIAPPNGFYLVVTHRHDLDLRIVEAVLRRDDFAFLGLIGSATKRRRFAHLLAERGFARESIARIVCPIGAPDIGGKEPGHIAVAVAAQLISLLEAHPARSAEEADLRERCATTGEG